jgi:hypothetical protein
MLFQIGKTVENTIETAEADENIFDVYDALCGRRLVS